MDSKSLSWALVSAAFVLVIIWSIGELTRSPRFIDEDVNLIAGTLLLDSVLKGEPRGELAAHSSMVTTGPLVTAPAAIAFRAFRDFRIARGTKYGWAGLMGAAAAWLALALSVGKMNRTWSAALAGLTVVSLLATPHLIIEVPQLLGEVAAIALLLAGLAAYISVPKHSSLWCGALLGLAVTTKTIVAPAIGFLIVFLFMFDRRSLAGFLGAFALVWLAFTGMQSWEAQMPVLDMVRRQADLVVQGRGSGLGHEASVAGNLLNRFQVLEYQQWPRFLQLHLWLFGVSALVLGAMALRQIHLAGPRHKVVMAAVSAFIIAEWMWFTWINDTMWIRHAVVAWAVLGVCAVAVLSVSKSKWSTGLVLILLAAHLLLGRAWVAAPRHVLPSIAKGPSLWWEGANTSSCGWHVISCTVLLPVDTAASAIESR